MLPSTQFFLWPFIVTSELVAAQADGVARIMTAACGEPTPLPKPAWATSNRVRLDLATMELRDFSTTTDGVATLVCAPFALHGATLADFATGHSLVQTLARNGCHRLFVTDWRSASKDMRLLAIDNYLAELNVAVDEIGAPVDLVGLCQGGIMALIYAARFPAKVRKLVLAGAPIDVDAAPSLLSMTAHNLPLGVFDEVARLGDGRVQGQRVTELWRPALSGHDAIAALQIEPCGDAGQAALLERFRIWFDWTVDLPGAYYHQTVLWLFKENRLAEGRFNALGREIDLAEVRHPLFLLAARDDELVAPSSSWPFVVESGRRSRRSKACACPAATSACSSGHEAWPTAGREPDAGLLSPVAHTCLVHRRAASAHPAHCPSAAAAQGRRIAP
jgi:poly(3-hydroxyalkanoate) synthetase